MNPSLVHASHCLSLTLLLLGVLHLYWAWGGSWGLAAALGRDQVDAGVGLRLAAGCVAFALVAAAAVVLGRVGVWGRSLPWLLFSWGTWALVAALLLGAMLNFTAATWLERLLFAPLALALAGLALGVARAPVPPWIDS